MLLKASPRSNILLLSLFACLLSARANNVTPKTPPAAVSNANSNKIISPPKPNPSQTSQQVGGSQQSQNQQQQQQPPRRRQTSNDEYLIGVGIADITGPAADINLMGYAKPNQDSSGIHLRQFSRSIIIEDQFGKRILYNSIDNGMISQLLRTQVLNRLKQSYGPEMYNESNVMMTASHSHSCPGGFFQYMLYNIPSAGFISQTLDSLVDGIARSVDRANNNMKPGKLYYNEGELLDASINRSPTSYENNPRDEREKYRYNTDKGMYLVKIVDRSGKPMAMLNWFAVHGTSMNNTNHLISSDNKGYASILFEQEFNPAGTLPGKGEFVAIFAQSNEGDVSPNTMGPRCVDSGLPCDSATSTCGNPPRNEKCIAFGPGKDMFESTKIIAYKQFYKARQLFMDDASLKPIRGPVRFIHEHIDITKQVVPVYANALQLASKLKRRQLRGLQLAANEALAGQLNVSSSNSAPRATQSSSSSIVYNTCPAALGYSFAAGTTDGPGAFDFQQGDTVSTRYWNMVRDFLRRPSAEQIKCHKPKPILLSTGEMDFPYMWHPKVVPTQILMIGQLAIVGLPGEFTTMAGRRVREAVKMSLVEQQQAKKLAPIELESDEETEEENAADASSGASSGAAAGDRQPGEGEGEEEEEEPESGARELRAPLLLGRRNKRSFAAAAEPDDNFEVVLSGLSNIYTSYITTIEEFEIQRYEGASTLYGPHTLQAYINQFKRLASSMIADSELPNASSSIEPPDLTKSLFTLKTGVIYDGSQHGHPFGSVLSDANSSKVYKCKDTVSVSFVAGNPRNDLRHEDSYLYVDRLVLQGNATKTWQIIATDSNWETKFIWERTNTLFGESKVTIIWDIPHDCSPGVFRIRHYGAHKNLLQTISQYSGRSSPFKVSNDESKSTLASLDILMEAARDLEAKEERQRQKQQQQQQKLNSGSQQRLAGQDTKTSPSSYSPLGFFSSLFGWRSN